VAVEAAYVGSSSHGLTGLEDINPFNPANPGAPRRLDNTPGNTPSSLGFLPQFMNVANANYNALQLSLKQQSSSVPVLGKMYYTLGYTWAHNIDDASGFRNASQVPFFQPHLFRASSDFDLRNVLTFSGGWDLPFNRGPKPLVKGWSLYPILSARGGFPVTVGAGLNAQNGVAGPSGAGDANLVNASLIAPVQYTDPHKQQTISTPNGPVTGFFFFSPASFGNTATGYGTAPRNLLRGPGRTNLDMSLVKVTPLYGERLQLKLSVDAFNIFNHTEFQTLSDNFSNSNLGQVLATYPARILQLGAHINF